MGTEGVGGGWDGAVRSESISSSLMLFAKFGSSLGDWTGSNGCVMTSLLGTGLAFYAMC